MPLTNLLSWFERMVRWFDSGTPRQNYIRHKCAHASVGITLSLIGYTLGYPWEWASLAFFLGVAKELWDAGREGSFRVGDVAWTFLPGAALLLFLLR